LQSIRRRPSLGGAVYVLPNLITTGNLFFGFFSIIQSLQGNYRWAASAILLAAVFDVLDGRVARLTGGTSEFGVQYDSLCDLVSFGLAPAFLMYQYGLHSLGRAGWIVCFLFLACGALRLARFNVQSSIGKSSGDFIGLPIPMAAAFVATYVATSDAIETILVEAPVAWLQFFALFTQSEVRTYFLTGSGVILALLMVSNIAYRSHKSVKLTVLKPFQLLVIFVLMLGVVAYQPELLGFLLSFFYALSGPFEWAIGWKKAVDDDEIFSPIDADESVMEPGDKKSE